MCDRLDLDDSFALEQLADRDERHRRVMRAEPLAPDPAERVARVAIVVHVRDEDGHRRDARRLTACRLDDRDHIVERLRELPDEVLREEFAVGRPADLAADVQHVSVAPAVRIADRLGPAGDDHRGHLSTAPPSMTMVWPWMPRAVSGSSI